MYVREKKVRRGNKEYRYYQLVQSTWVEGKSRQTVVRHLGALPDREYADWFARHCGYLCSVPGCGSEDTSVQEVRFTAIPRNKRRIPFPREANVSLCDKHTLSLKAGARLEAVEYDPDDAELVRAAWRKPPAGGRPRFVFQDRDSALKPTSWD
jgi:hypothetical protein